MLMINICKTKVKGARFEIYAAIGVSLRSEDVVSSLDPGQGWYVLNEELHVSALREHKENSFFRLFPAEVKMVPYCELNDGCGNPLDPTQLGVKYKKCDVLIASTLGL